MNNVLRYFPPLGTSDQQAGCIENAARASLSKKQCCAIYIVVAAYSFY